MCLQFYVQLVIIYLIKKWNVHRVDALKPYNIVFDYDRFEYELAVGLDFALAKALEPEEIIGACNFNGEIVYFMKWKREDEISYISSEHASNLYTEATIKFHEKYNNISQIVTTGVLPQQHDGSVACRRVGRPTNASKGLKGSYTPKYISRRK
ncbi:Chromobox 1 [Aphis craccivora]|uniref:Chromobox 1 n=1 Tax=Aphis craccivora TaxID=307492 RepID=A0A6G0Y2G6_APHCR|nr:Chromobox 1 [Aphis craccivora]